MGLKFRRGTNAQKSGSLAFGEPYVNTDLGTLQIGGLTGDITLGASGTGSQGSFAGISGSSLNITGNAKIDGNLTLGGAITIGDASADTVNVIASLSSSLIPQTTNAFDLGSATKIWRDLYISTGSIKFIDGSGAVASTLTANSLNSISSNTASVNTFTASVNGHIVDINTKTGSLETKNTTLATYTASLETKNTTLATYTASLETKNTTLATYTASVSGHITDINTKTGSLETKNTTLATYTASLETKNTTLATYTASIDTKFSTLQTLTASMTAQVSRLQESTSSLNAFTNSFNSAIQLTGSNVNIGGNLTVAGTTTTINSTAVAIADSVIELNYGGSVVKSGILTKDGTGGSTISGSLLWDGTNDYWIAGISGSEIPLVNTTGTQTLTNKTISGVSNTLSSIGNASLTNSSITIAGTSTALGGAITAEQIRTAIGTVVTGSAQIDGSLLGSNKTITVGSTAITLGGTATTIAGLTSVSSTGFTGALTGNASTATTAAALTTARTINGTSFNGSADITIPNLVSGSSQITYTSISSIPGGIVSGSSQVVSILSSLNTYTGSNDTTNTAQNTRLTTIESVTGSYETKGRGIVSGSAQIDGSLLGSNKTITIGSTSTTLGGTSTTLAGLTSVTSTTFVGALTGNASTVTTNANLTGNVTSVGNATTIASGVVTSDMIVDGTIVNGDINASAAIVDTKLATIATAGKVSNSATTATSANTVSAIVARDASGNFSAGTITAALTGNASTATTAAALTTARTINGTSFDGSANITIPNLVSGSAQITLSSTTGGTTSSNVQFNSLGIGMAASATAGRIDATNDVVAFSSSDIRFKENIVPIENALDKISKISGNTYDWKEENKIEHGYEGNDVGVIAQEIEAVLPQLVQTRENGFKAVKYDKLVALLIEGIKEQQTQIEKLRMDLDNYECKCDNCKSK